MPVVVTVAVALAGCQVRPLYADNPGPDGTIATGPRAELAAISVEPPDTRVEQAFRNELVFRLTGGGGAEAASRYSLDYILSESSNPLAIEREEDLPGAVLVTLNATFVLTDTASGRAILTGSTFASSSYDFSSQRFANVRALRDAQDRAAVTVAENINARLAAFFAART